MIKSWLRTNRGLRADLQRVHTDNATLEEGFQLAQNRLATAKQMARHIDAQLIAERKARSLVESELAMLRDRLQQFRTAQVAGDAA